MLALPRINDLFLSKEKQLNTMVGNLQVKDVKNDSDYNTAVAKIKKEILLTPVSFQDPEIKGHRTGERSVGASYEYPWPRTKSFLIVTVNFSFTGSSELFQFAPNSLTFSSTDTGVYQPDYNNVITVSVQVNELDKDQVKSRAREMMSTTFSLINQINPFADQWSLTKGPLIDELLRQKRKEILDFYS